MIYSIGKILITFFLKIFFHFRVYGQEALPANTPYIVASNHVSNLDPPTVGSACPQRLCYLAKEELFKNKLFGFILKTVGCIPLRREGADIRTMKVALTVLKKTPLLIFPQGTRGADFSKISRGVGFLYRKTKVPVIAARVYGTDKVLPKEAKFFHKGSISVHFSRVDTIAETDSDQEIARKVMEKIKSL